MSVRTTTDSALPTIGVDVGGTTVKAGIVAADGTLLVVHRVATPADGSDLIDAIGTLVERLIAEAPIAVQAIGIGLPAVIEQPSGRVRMGVNIALEDEEPARLLSQRFGRPVRLDNDANVAALAEHRLGVAKGLGSSVMLTLGTGVGGGVIVDGKVVRGGGGLGAELGHLVVDMNGPRCTGANCPNRGCIEGFASAQAFERDARDAIATDPQGAIARALTGGVDRAPEVFGELAKAGDPSAVAILNRAGRALGVALASLANIFGPEVLVIGGGVAALGDHLLVPACAELAARALSPFRDIPVRLAALGPDAGIVGAALLALGDDA